MKKAVLLINPFTSIAYLLDFFKSKGIAVCALYTRKRLNRSGYVLSELKKAKFNWELYSSGNLEKDVEMIQKSLKGYRLIYSFIGSELDDYAYCEALTYALLPACANDPKTAPLRYHKYEANEALRTHGIRCVKQKKAVDYQPGDIAGEIVVKPMQESCSEEGVKYFRNEETLLRYLKKAKNKNNLVVQERIRGNEYIVDSFSFQGKHTVIGSSQYERDNKSLRVAQHSSTTAMGDELEALVNYAFSVLDALNFTNGFTHMEIMLSPKGCYLVELNPRIPGAVGFTSYLYALSYNRHHITVWYEVVNGNAVKSVPTLTDHRGTVFLINNHKYAYDRIHTELIERLPSYKKLKIIKEKACKPRTQSRLNTVAFVLLASKDRAAVKRDIKQLIEYQENGAVFLKA